MVTDDGMPGTDREFTDPFTGEVLDDPERKSYRVTYSVSGGSKQKTVIDTLAKGRLTHDQAKEKLSGRMPLMGTPKSDISVHNVNRID